MQYITMAAAAHYLNISSFVRTRRDDGASLVEYALLVALIAVVCVAAITFFGESASQKFSTVADSVEAT